MFEESMNEGNDRDTAREEALAEGLARRQAALDEVREWLSRLTRERFTPEEIDPDTALFGSGLAMDSVDAVDLVIGLETVFGIKLPETERGRRALRTVNTLLDFILEAREAGETGGDKRASRPGHWMGNIDASS